ncbi:MAG: metal ABC transporter permease [Sulfolobales archaeon]
MDQGIIELFLQPYVIRGLIGVVLVSLVGAVMSVLIRYTQTQFLAVESLHMILAAASTGYLINLFFPSIPPEITTYTLMILLMILIGVLDYKRVEQNTSIAVVAFISATIATISSYGLALWSPVGPSIVYNILFGSPFFILIRDVIAVTIVSLLLFIILILAWPRILLLSFDPEYFEFLKGSRGLLSYRILVYSMVAVSSVLLTRVIGAIAAHILLIAPSITPFTRILSVRTALPYAVLVSLSSLIISLLANMPYGAVLGVLSIIAYVVPNLFLKRS